MGSSWSPCQFSGSRRRGPRSEAGRPNKGFLTATFAPTLPQAIRSWAAPRNSQSKTYGGKAGPHFWCDKRSALKMPMPDHQLCGLAAAPRSLGRLFESLRCLREMLPECFASHLREWIKRSADPKPLHTDRHLKQQRTTPTVDKTVLSSCAAQPNRTWVNAQSEPERFHFPTHPPPGQSRNRLCGNLVQAKAYAKKGHLMVWCSGWLCWMCCARYALHEGLQSSKS